MILIPPRLITIFLFLLTFLSSTHLSSSFRPPSIPLLTQSPFVQVWVNGSETLYSTTPIPVMNYGQPQDLCISVRYRNITYLLLGNPTDPWSTSIPSSSSFIHFPTYLQSPIVTSTSSKFLFLINTTLYINVTFTSPLLPQDFDLYSRPSHYVTVDLFLSDPNNYDTAYEAIAIYMDTTGTLVQSQTGTLMLTEYVSLSSTTSSSSSSSSSLSYPQNISRIGSYVQHPLILDKQHPDALAWGYIYFGPIYCSLYTLNPSSSILSIATVQNYVNTTRSYFFINGTLPSSSSSTSLPVPLYPIPTPSNNNASYLYGWDNTAPNMFPNPTVLPSPDPSLCYQLCNETLNCVIWVYSIVNSDCGHPQPLCWLKATSNTWVPNKCRISGSFQGNAQINSPIGSSYVVTVNVTNQYFSSSSSSSSSSSNAPMIVTTVPFLISIDELQYINYFNETTVPYWRRTLPLNDTSTPPFEMLTNSLDSYTATMQACSTFDTLVQTKVRNQVPNNDEYLTLIELIHRQVLGEMGLFWLPSKQTVYTALKEVSSSMNRDMSTADVMYPTFPLLLFHNPELLRLMLIPHFEYASNRTSIPYNLTWAPHHLGFWPYANQTAMTQENMPLEETSWIFLAIVAIGQRTNNNYLWLEPYWTILDQWINYLITLLPFPGTQLSTDDFDGTLYNATNLAIKGITAISAYGYLIQQYTNNATLANYYYDIAFNYTVTMINYAWYPELQHFGLGYQGSKGDCGNSSSWAMMYNVYWSRILGFPTLFPSTLMDQQRDWYLNNVLYPYGIPLNSRGLDAKPDWGMLLSAYYYPSNLSDTLIHTFYQWANDTLTATVPLSDHIYVDEPARAVNEGDYMYLFRGRSVLGTVYAHMLLSSNAETSGEPTRGEDTVLPYLNNYYSEKWKSIALP